MTDIFRRAEERRTTADRILSELQLVERWSRFGRPVVVGAWAYHLMVDPDLDMEIYCPELEIEHGFEILSTCAQHPRVTHAQFVNALYGPDQALYWQLHFQDWVGTSWKIDMWSAPEDYDLPRSEHFIGPMNQALTPETRKVILELKEQRAQDSTLSCLSIDLYRAVLQDGIRTAMDLREWLGTHETGILSGWKPEVHLV